MGNGLSMDAAPAVQSISLNIATLRGQRVILDADLATLYDVPTKRFNEAVKRNAARFPADFMFQLTPEEWEALRSQFATSNAGRGGRRHRPFAFTEHGAIMAAMLLNSPRAVQVSTYVVRAFVRLREAAVQHKELAERLAALGNLQANGLCETIPCKSGCAYHARTQGAAKDCALFRAD